MRRRQGIGLVLRPIDVDPEAIVHISVAKGEILRGFQGITDGSLRLWPGRWVIVWEGHWQRLIR